MFDTLFVVTAGTTALFWIMAQVYRDQQEKLRRINEDLVAQNTSLEGELEKVKQELDAAQKKINQSEEWVKGCFPLTKIVNAIPEVRKIAVSLTLGGNQGTQNNWFDVERARLWGAVMSVLADSVEELIKELENKKKEAEELEKAKQKLEKANEELEKELTNLRNQLGKLQKKLGEQAKDSNPKSSHNGHHNGASPNGSPNGQKLHEQPSVLEGYRCFSADQSGEAIPRTGTIIMVNHDDDTLRYLVKVGGNTRFDELWTLGGYEKLTSAHVGSRSNILCQTKAGEVRVVQKVALKRQIAQRLPEPPEMDEE